MAGHWEFPPPREQLEEVAYGDGSIGMGPVLEAVAPVWVEDPLEIVIPPEPGEAAPPDQVYVKNPSQPGVWQFPVLYGDPSQENKPPIYIVPVPPGDVAPAVPAVPPGALAYQKPGGPVVYVPATDPAPEGLSLVPSGVPVPGPLSPSPVQVEQVPLTPSPVYVAGFNVVALPWWAWPLALVLGAEMLASTKGAGAV